MLSNTIRRPIFTVLAATLILVLFTADYGHGAAKEKVLRVGLNSEADTLDPHLSTQLAERYVSYAVFNNLVGYDENFNPVPELAVSWRNPNPTTYVFKLREGVKFHDGSDFNASVVKWNLDRVLNPDTKSPYRGLLAPIKSVEVTGPYEVKMNLEGPFPGLLALLGDRVGFMLPPDVVQKSPADFGKRPIGTGPYKFVERVKDDHVTLEKFSGYWNKSKPPNFDKIIFRPIPDTSVREAQLRGGESDIIDDILPQDIKILESSGVKVVGSVTGAFIEIGMRVDQPPLNNKALRQAIAYAIDRKQVIDTVAAGYGEPGRGPLAVGWAVNPNLRAYSFDLEKAKQKMKEAGLDKVTVDITVSATPLYQQIGAILQQHLGKIGVNVNLKPIDYAKHYSMQRDGSTYCFVERWTPRADPGVLMYMHFGKKGSANNQRYENTEVEKLLADANNIYDQAKRKEFLQKAEQLVMDDLPIAFIYYPKLFAAMSAKVTGFKFYPDTIIRVRDLDFVAGN